MATTDPITGATINDQGDAATSGYQIGQVVQSLRKLVIPPFASVADRNAAYTAFVTAGGAMTRGMRCTVNGFDWVYNGAGPSHVAASWGSLAVVHYVELVKATGTNLNNAAVEGQGFAAGDVVRDADGYYTGPNATILTVPAGLGGLYLVKIVGKLSGGATGNRFIILVDINGSETVRANGTGDDNAFACVPVRIAAGGTVGVRALQNSGAARNLALELSLTLIGTV